MIVRIGYDHFECTDCGELFEVPIWKSIISRPPCPKCGSKRTRQPKGVVY